MLEELLKTPRHEECQEFYRIDYKPYFVLDALRARDFKLEIINPNSIRGLIDLIKYTKPKSVLEIGSYRGVSTEIFCLHCDTVVAIDPWPNKLVFEDFEKRTNKYKNLTAFRGVSPEVVEKLADNNIKYDLVYIDAEHLPDNVLQDINVALKVLKPDGWISGHDFFCTPNIILGILGSVRIFKDTSWCVNMKDISSILIKKE